MRKRLMLMAILCSCVSFAAWADGIDGDTDEENEKPKVVSQEDVAV